MLRLIALTSLGDPPAVNFNPPPVVNSHISIIFRKIMNAMGIKQELHNLIEKEDDLRLLEAIKTLLVKSSLDLELKSRLTSRALQAEEDIKAGKVYTREEFEKKLDERLVLGG